MKVVRKVMIAGLLLWIVVSVGMPLDGRNKNIDAANYRATSAEVYDKSLLASSGGMYDTINSLFDAKYDEFNSLGYFSQNYERSLQATYYALYTLNAIGKLEAINHTEVLNYIMSHYDSTSGIFMDKSAERYLHTDFSHKYYPLTTLLEVNCYAILSLQILGNLSLIDGTKVVNFIWDCYNYDTPGAGNGFIGQPYSTSLHPSFRNTTMDNTYYAILALDALSTGWSGRSSERLELQYFIKNLQITEQGSVYFGGFLNDLNKTIFDSLGMPDPTLLSSYYAVKGLDLLNYFMSFTEFNQYLDKHYDDSVPYFKMRVVIIPINYSDIVGTALGLQLADISGYSGIDHNGVVNFILNNRNAWGMWDSSRYYSYHELIDTFQVVRALYEAGEISHLSSDDRDQIANAIKQYYQQYDSGFSLLSKDCTSLRLLHTNVKSAFNIYAKTEFGDFIQEIYDQMVSCYYCPVGTNYHYFAGCLNMFQQSSVDSSRRCAQFRSFPVEFYNPLYGEIYNEIGLPYTHRTTFYALDILYNLGMMGSFEAECDLDALADDIIESQFLDNSYINYGGFLPHDFLSKALNVDEQDGYIYLEYTYYAIKCLELLANYLQIGDITNFGFDKDALGTYINKFYLGDHFDPWYSDDINTMLRNTYYMVYIMNLIEPDSLDARKRDKIKDFVVQNINYSNIKNVYFSYKISELLNLSIAFDYSLTHQLVNSIYSTYDGSFYLTTERNIMSDEVFLWICDMAKNDDMKITVSFLQPVELGSSINITVSLDNIILDYFGDDINVKFESSQIGTYPLLRQPDKDYEEEIFISTEKDNYPIVYGDIVIIEGFIEKDRLPITIRTTSDLYESTSTSGNQGETSEDSQDGDLIAPSLHTALPIMITLIALPATVIFITSKSRKKANGIQIRK